MRSCRDGDIWADLTEGKPGYVPHRWASLKHAVQWITEAGGLAASRGSDFHSPDESHTDLGRLPNLPGELTPVWELLADRIQ